jgi:hypothetical protein
MRPSLSHQRPVYGRPAPGVRPLARREHSNRG